MRKRIIAMLLAVTMCTELLAGCGAATVTGTVIGVEENESPEGQNAVLGTSLSVKEEETKVTQKTDSMSEAGILKMSSESKGMEEGIDLIQDLEETVFYADEEGTVRGTIITTKTQAGLKDARLTVRDQKGNVVGVQPCKLKQEYITDASTHSEYVAPSAGGLYSPPDVEVRLEAEEVGEITTAYKTDEKGSFVFRLPAPGSYTMTVEADNWEPHNYFKNETVYTLQYYRFSEEEFKDAVWTGIQKGLGKLASKEEMTEWLELLNEKNEEEWRGILASMGMSEEKIAAALEEIKRERERLSLVLTLDEEKFWKAVEGVSIEGGIDPDRYEFGSDLGDWIAGYLNLSARVAADAFADSEIRQEIIRMFTDGGYRQDYEASEQARQDRKQAFTEGVCYLGFGLLAIPGRILSQGYNRALSLGIKKQPARKTGQLLDEVVDIIQSPGMKAEVKQKRLSEISEELSELKTQHQGNSTHAMYYERNIEAVGLVKLSLAETGSANFAIQNHPIQLGKTTFTGFTAKVADVKLEMPVLERETIEAYILNLPKAERAPYEEYIKVVKGAEQITGEAKKAITRTLTSMQKRLDRFEALLAREDIGTEAWRKEAKALGGLFHNSVEQANESTFIKVLVPYYEQQRDIVYMALNTLYFGRGGETPFIWKLGIPLKVTKVTKGAEIMDTRLAAETSMMRNNLKEAVQNEVYLQRTEELVNQYLTGFSTSKTFVEELEAFRASMHSTVIERNGKIASGEKMQTIFDVWNMRLSYLLQNLSEAIQTKRRATSGRLIAELSQMMKESRSTFHKITTGEVTDISIKQGENLGDVMKRNICYRIGRGMEMQGVTSDAYNSLTGYLQATTEYVEKASAFLDPNTAKILEDTSWAVRNKKAMDYAYRNIQDMEQAVQNPWKWKSDHGIPDSLDAEPWSSTLGVNIVYRIHASDTVGIGKEVIETFNEDLSYIHNTLVSGIPRNLQVYTNSVLYQPHKRYVGITLDDVEILRTQLKKATASISEKWGMQSPNRAKLGTIQEVTGALEDRAAHLSSATWREIGEQARVTANDLMFGSGGENVLVRARNELKWIYGIEGKQLTDKQIELLIQNPDKVFGILKEEKMVLLKAIQEAEKAMEEARKVALRLRQIQVQAVKFRIGEMQEVMNEGAQKALDLLHGLDAKAFYPLAMGGVAATALTWEEIQNWIYARDLEETLNKTENGVLNVNEIVGMAYTILHTFRESRIELSDMNYEITLYYKPSLSGIVVDEGKNPLKDAKIQVTLFSEDDGQEEVLQKYELKSEKDGTFYLQFQNVQEIFSTHRMEIVVSKEGYTSPKKYLGFNEINYAGRMELGVIELTKQDIRVNGRVVDEKGKPISGANVSVGRTGDTYSHYSKTGEDGTFCFNTAAGAVWLNVSATGYESIDGLTRGAISITKNTDLGDIVLKAKKTEGTARGQILDLNGNPASHVTVQFQKPTGTKNPYTITTDSNGFYEIKLPLGNWTMSTTGGYDLPVYSQRGRLTGDRTWDVDMRDSLISTDLVWKPRYDANGNRTEARDVSFKPGDRIQVSLSVPGSKSPISLGTGTTRIPLYDNKGNIIGYGEATVTINRDGTVSVHLEGVRSGKYEVEIEHPTYGTGKLTYENLTGLPRENYLYMSQKKPQTSPSPKATLTPTVKPTATPTPKATASPTATPTPKATVTPTVTVTPTATPKPSPTPTVRPTPTVTPGVTPSPSPTPSATPVVNTTVRPMVSPAA